MSHGHGPLVACLLRDLLERCPLNVEVLLTVNVPEDEEHFAGAFPPERVQIIRNARPRGFGANHNAAFGRARGRHFAIVNPDVRFWADPLSPLLRRLDDPRIGAVAPRVVDWSGRTQDSARAFPTAATFLRRLVHWARPPEIVAATEVDWVAGMFIVLRRDVFAEVGGFDERFFLYCEDLDLCARLRRRGFAVLVDPAACVVHDARRASRRDPRHAAWHLASAVRYLSNRWRGAY